VGWLGKIVGFVRNPFGSYLKQAEQLGVILGGTVGNVAAFTVNANTETSVDQVKNFLIKWWWLLLVGFVGLVFIFRKK
jgi:hypothetical protein